MARFTAPTMAAVVLSAATLAWADVEPIEPLLGSDPAIPVVADDDYVRPGLGRGAGYGARGQFVDEDGDGINDLAPDADGDGIINHLDADFERAGAGQGAGQGRGRFGVANGPGSFVDADGDGINDLAPDTDGDGVINHLDDDYQRPGLGRQSDTDNARSGRGGGRGAQATDDGKSGGGGRGRSGR
jgi:hypothetical protein